ncbi:hypothetical protein FRX31_012429 [Thalictrum thalictroides]|uniref:Disease resistance protein n=1 Tax=Thalictrum thalictroides TaxID=46969 RepID=A0A7J6WKT5_THATH|nr:hypothetical protein FRX31_012429 [Thalictrum thalictroides]
MELVSPITAAVTWVVNCSTKHLNYLRALDTNLDQLEEEMAQLNECKSDVNNMVIAEEARLKKRTNQVNGWMQRVEAEERLDSNVFHISQVNKNDYKSPIKVKSPTKAHRVWETLETMEPSKSPQKGTQGDGRPGGVPQAKATTKAHREWRHGGC